MPYTPSPTRYEKMLFNRCGRSGLKLPAISLGLWHNFGFGKSAESKSAICRRAFDLGITHFDLANNYGPPPGAAETAFGDILRADFRGHRDELVVSTKAGYLMWPGPYGEWGGRKSLLASLDQSLKRMGLDYVDIFYSHRFDPETPLEETMGALDSRRAPGQGALCRHFLLQFPPHQGGGRDPQAARDALPHPPAELFDDQPLDRGRSVCSTRWKRRASARSCFRRWRRAS